MEDRLELEFLNRVIKDGFVGLITENRPKYDGTFRSFPKFIVKDSETTKIYDKLLRKGIIDIWIDRKMFILKLKEDGISYKRELEINLLINKN